MAALIERVFQAQAAKVDQLTIHGFERLDPVRVYLEEKTGKSYIAGRLTVTCYGMAWSCAWSNMGSSLIDFLLGADEGYIVDYLICARAGIATNQRRLAKEREYLARIVKAMKAGMRKEYRNEQT